MITGFVTTVVWKVTGLSDAIIYELVPAFLLSTLAVWGFSRKPGSPQAKPVPVEHVEHAE